MCWFILQFTGAHDAIDKRWLGPFFGDQFAIRLLTLSLRAPSDSIAQAVDVMTLSSGKWVPLSLVGDS